MLSCFPKRKSADPSYFISSSFLLPCILHLKMRWPTLSKWDVLVDIGIILFGIVAGLSGFVFSLKSLVNAVMKGK